MVLSARRAEQATTYYTGFIAIMVGFLPQWPTLPTLAMFPILLAVYRRLTIREEREVAAAFGVEWDA